MSALPPKADIHPWVSNVCFVPEADIAELYSVTSSAAAIRVGGTVSRVQLLYYP